MNQPQPSKEPKPKTIAPWLLIVFLIVLVGGGGYLAWYYFMGPGKAVKTSTTTTKTTDTTKTTTDTTTTAATSTADWKTYTNDTYEFSIKYPSTLTSELSNDGKTIVFESAQDKAEYDACKNRDGVECLKKAQLVVNIDAYVSANANADVVSNTLEQIVENRVSHNVFAKDPQKTTLDGQPAYEGIELGMLSSYDVVSKVNNHVFDLTLVQNCSGNTVTLATCKTQASDTAKTMLSTFQFTNFGL